MHIWNLLIQTSIPRPCYDAKDLFTVSLCFEDFKKEQNSALFDFSYANVPLSASFYDEGRDEGAMKILVLNTLKKSKFRRNDEFCKDSEDFIGFIFGF